MNSSKVITFASWLLLITRLQIIDAIECYSCTNATAICKCSNTVVCADADDVCFPCKCSLFEQVCYSEHAVGANGRLYNLGCRNKHACPTGSSSTIVGRDTQPSCSQCCDVSNCNRKLCQDADPSCADTKDFSCDAIGSTVNYCLDPHHAKSYCTFFCGLCSLRDGGWSTWSTWSSCDVTCENGTQTRMRTCTNPAPQDCGESCVGADRDVQTCSLALCPVHGGWTTWNSWGGCSVTCDVGMQRRDRACSHPFPARGGDQCPGDSRDDRVCLMSGCQDGGWSYWHPWSACTKTCGEGIRSRSRTCTNPLPSLTGHYCHGDSQQADTCNLRKCQDGVWSSWNSWSSCTRSCGDGLRSRYRTCTNPRPSMSGNYCDGYPQQTDLCNLRKCSVKLSAFTVTNPTGTSTIKFTHIVTNLGSDYSATTGKFTCQNPGLYLFTISITKIRSRDDSINDRVVVYIRVNGLSKVRAQTDPHDDSDNGSYEATATLTVHLARGDYVDAGGGYPASHMESWSQFSGVLILPD